MKQIDKYIGKKVLVLGLAKSGYMAAKLLDRLGAIVTVNDKSDLDHDEHAKELEQMGIQVIGGSHPLELITNDLFCIVKNPGIPYRNPLLKEALKKNIPIITEVEIAGELSESEFIGVTGSNGKTTTTMMLGEMMKGSRFNPLVAGNIGTVLSGVVEHSTKENVIVTELSSFQLLGTKTFHPHVAVVLNIFGNHLDYHGSIEEYAKAKSRITVNQTEDDFLVYNAENKEVLDHIVSVSKAKKVPFSSHALTKEGAYIEDDQIYFKNEKIMSTKDVMIRGFHNLENALAALAAAKIYGVSSKDIKEILANFSGAPHRCQLIHTLHGRLFYNDSKATNILATSKALATFPDQSVILLAGGLDRGNTFDDLVPHLTNVKAVITFGETKEKIIDACQKAGIEMIKIVQNVEEAVPVAYRLSEVGDIILLSPACASWDQYDSFEQRGDIFVKHVHMLN
ncbi:UDP-N-acetylmuramoyl-L-alanine--D-glutamate ligase [Terrilactibacillus sp. BCM23-1]|uniref:UDP-N-acetylmuramoylalanine--D-glutamate ligase n=1 Tax=Terrilactibacillus tamarindi TaxID=2599694 RepID=A0A6N8CUZ3_9BACI|nr:UDP-N-acetylmuramoyl-L-alanine--D-glutamate ligase [Terrilactibacillus tamarindi]MTT32016.1 UDP-N-acetylmuramoyl-L-alanine--D-glutamate ligase [Terrilactibacillus tamarindi]